MKIQFILPLLFSGVGMAQSAGSFTATGNLSTAAFTTTATLLPNRKVLIAGGVFSPPPIPTTPFFDFLASAELYDPATGEFTPTGSMSAHRAFHTAILLANGKVLIVGGGYSATRNSTTPPAEPFPRPVTCSWPGRLVPRRHY